MMKVLGVRTPSGTKRNLDGMVAARQQGFYSGLSHPGLDGRFARSRAEQLGPLVGGLGGRLGRVEEEKDCKLRIANCKMKIGGRA